MEIKGILREQGFRFKKNFGQNFLTDDRLLSSIAEVGCGESAGAVLEIGPGAGTLTRMLSKRAEKVVAMEIDRTLAPILEKTLAGCGNVRVVFGDVMKTSMEEIEQMMGGPFRLVANLPYYITTPVLMKFIEQSRAVQSLTIMVQKEVALRLCAEAGTADYGAITVAISAVADAKITTDVPRTMFYPVPNVDSAVVHIEMNPEKYGEYPKKMYRDVVRAAFTSRRKTLVNNMMTSLKLSRQEAEDALTAIGEDVKVRGEQLSAQAFVELAKYLERKTSER